MFVYMKSLIFGITLLLSTTLSAQKHWNTSAKFNGNTYLAISESVLKEARPKLTVEFWIKPGADSSSETVFGNKQFWILLHNGKVRFDGNGANIMYSASLLKGKTWTHVAAVYDGAAGTAKIYLNGVLDNTGSRSGTLIAQTDSFVIGKKYYNNFTGEIDELRVWRTARTADEILKNYKTHIANWNLNDIFNYGELAYVQSNEAQYSDSGFSVPNCNITGNIIPNTIGTIPSKTVRHNNSLYFAGGSFSYLESVTANDSYLAIDKEMTIEAWINPQSFDDRMVIADLTGGGGGGGFQLATIYDGKLNFSIHPQATTTAMGLATNTWYHVAVVVDSISTGNSRSRIYVNGALVNTAIHNSLLKNTGKLRIGASHSNDDYFKGYMDEFRISNYAKTPAQLVLDMYNPVHKFNQPVMPKYTVAYNFDGGYFSSTGKGPNLQNSNQTCRFTYYNEPIAPLFSLGGQHQKIMSSFTTVQRAAFLPAAGNTQGVVSDTLFFNKAVKIDPKTFKVFLAITHNNISDLKIELVAPTGESVVLINQLTSVSGNQLVLVIDTTQTTKISDLNFVDHGPRNGFSGTFNTFSGINSKGTWTLKVSDLSLGNTGRLHSWGIYADGEAIQNSSIAKTNTHFISMFPNPVTAGSYLNIDVSLTNKKIHSVIIENYLGQTIMNIPANNVGGVLVLQIKPEMVSGCYVVKLVGDEATYSAKLSVIN